ncbi:esterase/lipase [Terriglobus roseus DSM 18391]|uniref:Esterase/lipase n=1 Tax=Terriglobus roseus (strain DSM 18391 / NRRL B-41598 / KBS 63) TaxID=926566 RepID=I3ZJ27_TERRK|nr:alpha/beta hydrolase [Terriglobus roseus]AFL89245.1 esterase/lipase [Terriglobus roseus DSM 18391]
MMMESIRNDHVRTWLCSLMLLGSAVSLKAQQSGPAIPASYVRVDGITYAQGKSAPLLADMYVPKGPGLHPAIVYIHGGGWTGGSRTGWDKLIAPFAEHGYVGMAIDYDLSPGVRFPIALEECKEAVRWLRAHAIQYHVDPNRIAVAGGSAGGELAALVALTNGDNRYEVGAFKNFSSSVKAAVLYSADLDLTKFSDTDDAVHPYLGGSCSAQHALCLEASPQFHLHGNLPPIYIGQGNADEDVPYSQFTSFVDAYRKANGAITPFTAEGGPHSYAVDPRWFQANVDAVLSFLQKNL